MGEGTTRSGRRESAALLVLAGLILALAAWLIAGLLDSSTPGEAVDGLGGGPSAAEPRPDRSPPAPHPGGELATAPIEVETGPAGESAEPRRQVRAHAGEASAVSGLVVERFTRTPVSGVRVELAAGGDLEWVEVDARGRFRSSSPFPHGPLRAEVSDIHSATVMERLGLEHRGELLELRVPTGPTIHLELDLGERPEGWRARIEERARPHGERLWPWVPLRDPEQPWVRFLDQRHEPHGVYEPFLVVRSEDGTRGGEALLETTRGLHPGVVEVRLESFATLRGRVVDETSAPIWGAAVILAPWTGGVRAPELDQWTEKASGEDGRFAYEKLLPGPYRLSISLPRRPPRTQQLVLFPGTLLLPDEVFAAIDPAGALRGRVELDPPPDPRATDWSRRESPSPATLLRLRAADGRDYEAFAVAGAQGIFFDARGGPSTFAFEDLPPGQYEIEVIARPGERYSPRRLLASPPTDGLVFTKHVGEQGPVLAFAPTDGEDRELTGFHALLGDGERWRTSALALSAGSPIPWSGELSSLEWILLAPGFRPARGDEADFGPAQARALGTRLERLARPRMEPGFGAALFLRDAGYLLATPDARDHLYVDAMLAPPVAGAEILADGQVVGTSDEKGFALLSLESAPKNLQVRKPGWTAIGGRSFDRGLLMPGTPDAVIWMAAD